MQREYPWLEFGMDPASGDPAFEGELPLVTQSGIRRSVPVRVVFPLGYPDEEPGAFDYMGRFLPHSLVRHFYSEDGHCCLWLPWDSEWNGQCAEALLDYMAHVSIFFTHQLLFDRIGRWPVPARPHGASAYREFLVERLEISDQEFPKFVPLLMEEQSARYARCPCGSGHQAVRCHLPRVKELISKIGRPRLRRKMPMLVSPVAAEQAFRQAFLKAEIASGACRPGVPWPPSGRTPKG